MLDDDKLSQRLKPVCQGHSNDVEVDDCEEHLCQLGFVNLRSSLRRLESQLKQKAHHHQY